MINDVLNSVQTGAYNTQELEQLRKALAVGVGYTGRPTDLVGAGVLQMESLDSVLTSVTFEMKDLVFWGSVPMDKAESNVEEYNRKIGQGAEEQSPYIIEGGAGQENDSLYIRDVQTVALFCEKRKVTDIATLVKTSMDMEAEAVTSGTMSLLKSVERECYRGSAYFCDATGAQTGSNGDLPLNLIHLRGLYKQILQADTDERYYSRDFVGYGIESLSSIKDLEGKTIAQDDVEESATVARINFGFPKELHSEIGALSAFAKQFYPIFRSQPGLSGATVGYDVSKVTTTAGVIDLKPNNFLQPEARVRPSASNPRSPLTSGLSIAGAAAGSGSKMLAGNYHYAIKLINDFGESAPIATTSAVTVTAGQEVTIAITGTIPSGTKFFKLYRADGSAASTAQFIGNYQLSIAGSIKDIGSKKPGLGEAYLLDFRPSCIKFKQLLPLSKKNLATVATAKEFLILLYGMLIVYSPKFCGVMKNVANR